MTVSSKRFKESHNFLLSQQGDIQMASNKKQTKIIRANKKKPHKANLKKDQKRIQKNAEILRDLASKA